MADQQHWIAGFFDDLERVQSAQRELLDQGLPQHQMQVFKDDAEVRPTEPEKRVSSDAALKDILVDTVIGGAVGVGLGALAEVAIVAANVSLFVASPLLAPLTMLGWGASLGATVGAMLGAEKKSAPLSVLVQDAVSNGQIVLIVQALNDQEAATARQTMQAAVGEVKEVLPIEH